MIMSSFFIIFSPDDNLGNFYESLRPVEVYKIKVKWWNIWLEVILYNIKITSFQQD